MQQISINEILNWNTNTPLIRYKAKTISITKKCLLKLNTVEMSSITSYLLTKSYLLGNYQLPYFDNSEKFLEARKILLHKNQTSNIT